MCNLTKEECVEVLASLKMMTVKQLLMTKNEVLMSAIMKMNGTPIGSINYQGPGFNDFCEEPKIKTWRFIGTFVEFVKVIRHLRPNLSLQQTVDLVDTWFDGHDFKSWVFKPNDFNIVSHIDTVSEICRNRNIGMMEEITNV